MKNDLAKHGRAKQRGLVLPLVLIFLTVLMLLATSVLRNVTLEEKMAGNLRSRTLAFQAAEQGLRWCENHLQAGDAEAVHLPINSEGPLASGAMAGRHYWQVEALWQDPAYAVAVPAGGTEQAQRGAQLAARPQCMVELINTPLLRLYETAAAAQESGNQRSQFRITARGFGMDSQTMVQLQSYLVL
jgi:type IV pilus assembly protein PilX